VIYDNGLGVGPSLFVGGAISDVAYRDVALSQTFQHFGREDVVDYTCVLVGSEEAVVIYDNAATLLSPVLKGKQSVINRTGYIVGAFGKYSENPAFFPYFAQLKNSSDSVMG